MNTSFPSLEVALCLHQRLLSQDATTPNDVCRAFLEPLVAWLSQRFPHASPHLSQTAAEEALLAYFQCPAQFDPQRLDLAAYLRMAARRDLHNLLAREARHFHLISDVPVEDEPSAGNSLREEPLQLLLARERGEQARRVLTDSCASLTGSERIVLDLMMNDERRTIVYAAALGIDDRSPADQRTEVKRLKDRIKKRILRGGDFHDEPRGCDGRPGAA